jgi:hypothetical protein
MKYLVVFCLTGLLLGACVTHNQPTATTKDSLADADSTTSKNRFFPVADFLETEILAVDSAPLALCKYVVHGKQKQTDSAFISVPAFNTLAREFLPAELRDSGLEKHFTESSFADRATRSINFTYSPVDKDAALQRVDVMTMAGPRAQEVRSIYLEKRRVAGDSVIMQKLLWQAKHSFQIITLTRVKGGPPIEDLLRVVWNDGKDE